MIVRIEVVPLRDSFGQIDDLVLGEGALPSLDDFARGRHQDRRRLARDPERLPGFE